MNEDNWLKQQQINDNIVKVLELLNKQLLILGMWNIVLTVMLVLVIIIK